MNQSNPLVEKQYSEWVYPEPILDIAEWKARGNQQVCDPSVHHAMLWPERAPNPNLSILVAGCGTSQSAILAYNNPTATVLGIDLSPTSLQYTAALKEKHNLKNLELQKLDLHDVGVLGKKFDLIYSTGVLHHLPDPQKGLQSISKVLADDGVMCLMLYGKYLRAGVYWIQEALARMGIGQNKEGIAFTRALIGSLPPWHAVQAYIQSAATDLVYDGGLVDTFLHNQDRAYSVPEVLELIKNSGLSFQGWSDNLLYYPDGLVPEDHPTYHQLAPMPDEQQWAVVELLIQNLGTHGFLVRKHTGDDSAFRIDYNKPSFLKTIPSRRFASMVTDEDGVIDFRRSWHHMKFTGLERSLYLAVNGKVTIEVIIAAEAKKPMDMLQAQHFFKRMARLGHFTFSWIVQ